MRSRGLGHELLTETLLNTFPNCSKTVLSRCHACSPQLWPAESTRGPTRVPSSGSRSGHRFTTKVGTHPPVRCGSPCAPPLPPKKPLHTENGSFPSLLSLSWIFSFFFPRGTTNCVQIFTHSNLVFWAIWNSNNYKQTRIIPPSPLMDLSRGDKKIKHFSFLPQVIFKRRLIF